MPPPRTIASSPHTPAPSHRSLFCAGEKWHLGPQGSSVLVAHGDREVPIPGGSAARPLPPKDRASAGRSLAPANPGTAPAGSAWGVTSGLRHGPGSPESAPLAAPQVPVSPLGVDNRPQLENTQRQGWGGTPQGLPPPPLSLVKSLPRADGVKSWQQHPAPEDAVPSELGGDGWRGWVLQPHAGGWGVSHGAPLLHGIQPQ